MAIAKASSRLYSKSPYICRSCMRRQAALASPRAQVPQRALHQNYLRKQEDARKAWQEQAEEIRAGKRHSMLSILESRGYISQIAGTRDALDTLLTEKRIGAYAGIDPTAPSLHVGHLVPLMVLYWLYVHGYHAVSLLGGATSKIGDPTGRTTSREETDSTTRKINMVSMHYQLKQLWQRAEFHARQYGFNYEWAWHRELLNNNIWLNKLPVIDVLRLLGPGLRMGPLLGKETVRTKLNSGVGMSFAEFMYPILQSWDWWHLYEEKQIQIQIGGSDQYGNITAGIDAINYIVKHHHDPRVRKEDAGLLDKPLGFTTPLLTTSSGEKFGKSAGNAIWLDKELTSNFDLYQFFLRTADADVERYLKLFTFIPIPDIVNLMSEHNVDASKRIAQHKLAYECLCLIHGPGDAKDAAAQHAQMFSRRPVTQSVPPSNSTAESPSPSRPADISNALNKKAPITTVYDAPSLKITLPTSLVVDRPIAKVLHSAGLVASGSEGHRLCAQQGAYVGSRPNNHGPMLDQLEFTPCKNWRPEDTNRFIIDGKVLILRVGKWRMKIINIITDKDFDAKGMTAPGWPLEEMLPAEGNKDAEPPEPTYDPQTGARIKINPRPDGPSETQIKKAAQKAEADAKLEKILGEIRALWKDEEDLDPNRRQWKDQAEREIEGMLKYGSINERKKMALRYRLDPAMLKKGRKFRYGWEVGG